MVGEKKLEKFPHNRVGETAQALCTCWQLSQLNFNAVHIGERESTNPSLLYDNPTHDRQCIFRLSSTRVLTQLVQHDLIWDDKPEVPSHNPSMFIILWDVKEPAHLSLRVGHVVPGVVVCLLLCIMIGRVKNGHSNWHKLLWRSASLTGKVNKITIQASSGWSLPIQVLSKQPSKLEETILNTCSVKMTANLQLQIKVCLHHRN